MPNPSSVEEAGAELGAAITRIGLTSSDYASSTCTSPPAGMHSSFSTYPISSMELFLKLKALLHQLQSQYKQYQQSQQDFEKDIGSQKNKAKKKDIEEPLSAAPSILAVLLKLLGVTSSNISTLNGSNASSSSGAGGGLNLASIRRSTSNSALSRSNHSHHGPSPSRSSSSSNSSSSSISPPTVIPPLLSSAIRNIWVQCVAHCLIMGDLGKGRSRIDIYEFTRKMMTIASFNPKSAKASGGARLAALQVISSIFTSPALTKKVSPWALEIFSICLSGLRSGGTHDPTHRLNSIQLACSLLYACRTSVASEKQYKIFLFHSAMEEKALLEAIKVLKRACEDRFPEVRSKAAEMAGLIGNVALFVQSEATKSSSRSISKGIGSGKGGGSNSLGGGSKLGQQNTHNPFIHLEEIISLIMKNMDDECPGVAAKWSEALARCFCVTIAYGAYSRESDQLERSSNRNVEGDEDTGGNSGGSGGGNSSGSLGGNRSGGNSSKGGGLSASGRPSKFMSKLKNYSENRKGNSTCATCSSLSSTLQFLVDTFIRVGGELGASKCGGSFSSGGRAVRLAITQAMTHLIRLQLECGGIGQDGISYTELIHLILKLVGPNMEIQLPPSESLLFIRPIKVSSQQQTQPSILNYVKAKSVCDPGLVRVYVNEILRSGLAELSSEMAQLSILHDLTAFCSSATIEDTNTIPNSHQLQVVLVEISHLIATLGEASASALPDILKALRICLSHKNHGVRFEACTVYASLTCSIPDKGALFLTSCLEEVKRLRQSVLELPEQPSMSDASVETTPTPRRRIRRGATSSPAEEKMDKSERLQCSLHGNALAVSMILLKLPSLSCGVKTNVLDDIISTAECLIMSVFDEELVKKSPVSASTCVRSGYFMISSAMTIGPHAITNHVALLFHLWKQSSDLLESPHESLNKYHQLICLEGFVASLVTFLRSCSSFLLSVPHALSEVTAILERVLDSVAVGGNFSKKPKSSSGIFFWKHLQVLMMEAFCWLPPGSFQLSTEKLFVYTAEHIKMCTASDISTSLLPHLVSKEDCILDASPICRATVAGQVMGAKLENSLISLAFNPTDPVERETVLHAEAWKTLNRSSENFHSICGSKILGMLNKEDEKIPPTPLHKIGTWQEPASPNLSVKIRLIDFAIQAFAASFGSQDNSEKEKVGIMFEMMMATTQQSGSRVFMSENEKNNIKKQELAISSNISTTILACVKSLPFYEAYIDDKIRVGSPWMTKTADVLFSLLPSCIYLVRRAAAEGLASLAAVGLSENKHSVQSSILHSLDEVMQGNLPDGTVRKVQNEALISSRSGVLLALACLQRSINSLFVDAKSRSQERSHAVDNSPIAPPPTMIMMTRVLACLSTTIHEGDSMMVRASALHAFGILISYSFSTAQSNPGDEQFQILRKAVELIEFSFLSIWRLTVSQIEKGAKEEKFEMQPVLLAVLIRLMTSLLHKLHFIEDSELHIKGRFCAMVDTIMEFSGFHPAVIFEGLAFYERISDQEQNSNENSFHHEKIFDYCISCISLNQDRPSILVELGNSPVNFFLESTDQVRAILICIKSTLGACDSKKVTKRSLHVSLFRMLESCVGKMHYLDAASYKHIAAGRDLKIPQFQEVKIDVQSAIQMCMILDISSDDDSKQKRLLHWLLFSRFVATGNIGKGVAQNAYISFEEENLSRETIESIARDAAAKDAFNVLELISPNRWQVKLQAMEIAIQAISDISKVCIDENESIHENSHFNPIRARHLCVKKCRELNKNKEMIDPMNFPPSFVALHLEELVTAACVTSVATSDQTELHSLQASGIQFLIKLMMFFDKALDPDDNSSNVLQQFSSQIVSSVKHSIAIVPSELQDEIKEIANEDRFLYGCEALKLVININLVNDPIVLRRLLRPLLYKETEICSFPKTSDDLRKMELRPANPLGKAQLVLSQRLGSLNALSDLWLSASSGALPDTVGNVIVKEIKNSQKFCAINAGVLSLDAALIMHLEENEESLIHTLSENTEKNEMNDEDLDEESKNNHGGLTFSNLKDVGEPFSGSLKESWPKLIAFSVLALSNLYDKQQSNKEEKEHLLSWLRKLVPLLFSSIQRSLSCLPDQKQLDNLTCSVHSLRKSISVLSEFLDTEGFAEEFSLILSLLSKKIILHRLGLSDSNEGGKGGNQDTLAQTQGLFQELCNSLEHNGLDCLRGMLIKVVYTPLNLWQNGSISNQVEKNVRFSIMTSYLHSARGLVKPSMKEKLADGLLRATVHLSMSMLTEKCDDKNIQDSFNEAASSLLKECISNPSLSNGYKQAIANEAARLGSWDAWAIVCTSLQDNSGIMCSVEAIREALDKINNIECHGPAVKGLRTIVQDNNSFIVPIMTNIGGNVMNLLRLHGISSIVCESALVRTSIYADAMRITMLTLQQLMSTSTSDDDKKQFLEVLFVTLVEIIEYNGLPNNPKNNSLSDPAIGRMCAQAILHAVKNCPLPSKAAIALMDIEKRSALEFAVRAEMTGYGAPAASGPIKKKLSLKKFTKV